MNSFERRHFNTSKAVTLGLVSAVIIGVSILGACSLFEKNDSAGHPLIDGYIPEITPNEGHGVFTGEHMICISSKGPSTWRLYPNR